MLVLVIMSSLVWIVFHALYISDAYQREQVNEIIRNSTSWYDVACPTTAGFKQVSLWQDSCVNNRLQITRHATDALNVLQPQTIEYTVFHIRHEIHWFISWMPDVAYGTIVLFVDKAVQLLLRDRNQWYAITTGITVFMLYALYLRVFTLEYWRLLKDVWKCKEPISIRVYNGDKEDSEFTELNARAHSPTPDSMILVSPPRASIHNLHSLFKRQPHRTTTPA
jgi:hypothetical protein